MQPLIIETAINGGTSKARNPHVPRTPDEIAADGLACLAAGAAIVHSHIEDPYLAGPAAAARYGEGWAPILARHADALLCPTMPAGDDADGRIAHLAGCAALGARLAPFDPGSMNMVLAGGPADTATSFAYVNSFAQIARVAEEAGRLSMGLSLGIYEPGFLRAAVGFHRAGKLPPGSMVKFYFFGGANAFDGRPCVGFGLDPTASALDAYLEVLGDSGLPWAAAVIGGCVFGSGMAKLAIARGGHVRLGLEDFAGDGSPSNGTLLAEVVALGRELGRPPASSAEAAGLLGL